MLKLKLPTGLMLLSMFFLDPFKGLSAKSLDYLKMLQELLIIKKKHFVQEKALFSLLCRVIEDSIGLKNHKNNS